MRSTFLPRRTAALAGAALSLALFAAACGDDSPTPVVGAPPTSAVTTPAATGPAVRFVEPVDRSELAGSVHLVMEATDFTIEPAGDVHAGAGHLHVIADKGCVATGTAIPKDADHV